MAVAVRFTISFIHGCLIECVLDIGLLNCNYLLPVPGLVIVCSSVENTQASMDYLKLRPCQSMTFSFTVYPDVIDLYKSNASTKAFTLA